MFWLPLHHPLLNFPHLCTRWPYLPSPPSLPSPQPLSPLFLPALPSPPLPQFLSSHALTLIFISQPLPPPSSPYIRFGSFQMHHSPNHPLCNVHVSLPHFAMLKVEVLVSFVDTGGSWAPVRKQALIVQSHHTVRMQWDVETGLGGRGRSSSLKVEIGRI